VQDVYILSAVRTPIGKFGGKLAGFTSPDRGVVGAPTPKPKKGVVGSQQKENKIG
jgi:acetyl-CoA C-acetyltransferase